MPRGRALAYRGWLAGSAVFLSACWLSLDFSRFHGDKDAGVGDLGVVDQSAGDLTVCTPAALTFLSWETEDQAVPGAGGFGGASAVTLSDGRLLLIGGEDGGAAARTAILELQRDYDFSSSTPITWQSIGALPTPLLASAAVVLPNDVTVLAGGAGGPTGATSSGYLLVAPDGGVTQGSSTTPSYILEVFPSAALGPDGRPYFFGGRRNSDANADDTVWRFEADGGWSQSTSLTSFPPALHTARYRAAGANLDGQLLAIGGLGRFDADAGTYPSLADNEALSSIATTWQPFPALPAEVGQPAAVIGADGRLYVVALASSPLTTYVYDPCSATWRTAISTTTASTDGAAVAVGPDGRIYAIGGGGARGVLAYGPRALTGRGTSGVGAADMATADDFFLWGRSFAASATVTLYAGTPDEGTALGTLTADVTGAIGPAATPPQPAFHVLLSQLPIGVTRFTLVDDASHYPVTVPVPSP